MAVYSTNQNRQFYVATASGAVSAASNPGTIKAKITPEGELFFIYKGKAPGAEGLQCSDRIPLKNLDYVKVIPSSAMETKMRKIYLTLAEDPIAGQNYVLRIAFKQFHGMSDEHQYFKDAVVKATSDIASKSDFYKEMVNALNRAFSREVGATSDSNPYLAFSVDNNSTATKIIIEEKEQVFDKALGKFERVLFDIIPTFITTGEGEDAVWLDKDSTTGNYYTEETTAGNLTTVKNGNQIAALEWFCMGERGDQYRMMGYPNYIPTEYMVDSSKSYDVIEFHFAFTDTGVNSYRSEKDITIVADDASSNTIIKAVYGDVNTVYKAYTGGSDNLITPLT